MASDPDAELALGLLYRALIEIRAAAHFGNNERARQLADVFHNHPGALTANSRLTPTEALEHVRRSCEGYGLAAWYDQAVEIVRNPPPTTGLQTREPT